MCSPRILETVQPSASVPQCDATSAYEGWCRKNSASLARASRMERRCAMSCWHRFTTPTYPSRSGTTSFRMYASASVPRSMMSSLVMTPIVRLPSSSTSRESVSASLLARSELPGVTARMRHDGRLMYERIISRICFSMSAGWSPTGTRVMPGKSTSVIVSTCGEQIFRRICFSETPLFEPEPRSVSASISPRMASKSVNTSPGRCRNSPHSAGARSWCDAWLYGVCTSCSTSGLRVQMSGPRGRKSRPTSASRTLDLPLLCEPTTAIWGSSSSPPSASTPAWLKIS